MHSLLIAPRQNVQKTGEEGHERHPHPKMLVLSQRGWFHLRVSVQQKLQDTEVSAFQLQCPPVTYFLLLIGMRSFLSFSTLRNWRSCLKSSEGNAIKRNKVLLWRLVKKVYGSWIKEERSGGYNPSKVNFGRGERIFWYCCRFLGNFLVCTCACMVWWQT